VEGVARQREQVVNVKDPTETIFNFDNAIVFLNLESAKNFIFSLHFYETPMSYYA